MEDYCPVRIKRKQLEDVNDEFSDFSLSSPATKIRRLDTELPPIIEEKEHDTPMMFSQPEPLMENGYVGEGGGGRRGSVVIEDLGSALPVENEERAIVLFKPMDATLLQSPSPYSYSVSSKFITGLKYQVLWSNQSDLLKPVDSETEKEDENYGCLAVVPWVPTHSQPPPTQQVEAASHADMCEEMMETDETGVASMDVEEENHDVSIDQRPGGSEFGRMMSMNEGINMWPQGGPQHCLLPQLPQNLPTPVTWFR